MRNVSRNKTIGSRKILDSTLIVTEGQTECNYFNQFKRYIGHTAVQIKCSQDRSPHGILQKAIELKNMRSKSASGFYLPYDKVWIMFDKDETPQNDIDETIAQAGRNDISVAFSQPCFELWLLLHFVYSEREFSSYKELERELQKFDPSYSKSKNLIDYMPKIGDAIKNARQLYNFAEIHGIKSKSYTTVYRVIEELERQVERL